MSGTSMATPVAAGGAALARQFLRDKFSTAATTAPGQVVSS